MQLARDDAAYCCRRPERWPRARWTSIRIVLRCSFRPSPGKDRGPLLLMPHSNLAVHSSSCIGLVWIDHLFVIAPPSCALELASPNGVRHPNSDLQAELIPRSYSSTPIWLMSSLAVSYRSSTDTPATVSGGAFANVEPPGLAHAFDVPIFMRLPLTTVSEALLAY